VTARRAFAPPTRLAGAAVAALVLGVVVVALLGLAKAGGRFDLAFLTSSYIGRLLAISTVQAAGSTALSLALGIPLALALARRATFPGRRLLLGLLATATVLPGIVVVFAVVAVYGRSGLVGSALRAVGIEPGGWLYGLPGILIAHVLLNAPFCARVMLRAFEGTEPEAHRLAAQLGLTPLAVFLCLDRPVIRREAPALAALIFLLCFTSFATVLALGGGPDRATLEVAIYEALRLDADFARAASLSILQLAIGLVLATAYAAGLRRARDLPFSGRPAPRADLEAPGLRGLDAAVLVVSVLLVAPPLLSVAAGAANIGALADPDVAQAMVTSLAFALFASLLATGCAILLALAAAARGRPPLLVSLAAYAPLAVPPFTLVAGLFVVLRPFLNTASMGPPMVVLVNAMMALPFCIRLVEPPLRRSEERHGRVADMLGLAGLSRLRLLHGPVLRAPALASLAMAGSLSLGDLGVVAFFGGPDLKTLPLLLYERLGAYRTDEAAALALLLAVLVFGLALLAIRGGETRADAA
jgi:thiamine transport system permease protein